MDAKKCDRCGQYYDEYVDYASINIKFHDAEWHDLCPECVTKLVMFLEMEEEEEKRIESTERKESNIEWTLNEIKKGYFYFNTCKIANCIKNGKPCGECDECEFQYNEDAVDYLLAPHEDSSYD